MSYSTRIKGVCNLILSSLHSQNILVVSAGADASVGKHYP